ncbi:MAG: Rieske 2Fe-2S domain-containing protein [Polyangia bacterium]
MRNIYENGNGLPTPNGWYAVATSADVTVGTVVPRRLGGEDILLFRSDSGEIATVGAYCAHLGAHMGHGGKVVDHTLQCPFHGYRYNREGACVANEYGTDPPAHAKLRSWPTRENGGFVLVYFGSEEEGPPWEVPTLDTDGWTDALTAVHDLDTHPQETTENSVDIGHFTWLHGYASVKETVGAHTDGPYLGASYRIERSAGVFGSFGGTISTEFDVHVFGLGYSLAEVHIPKMGLRLRNFVLPVPTDPGRITLRLGLSVAKSSEIGKVNPALRLLPRKLALLAIRRMAFRGFVHDVNQDFTIWQNKRYLERMAMSEGDGPIGLYRQWARQFYTERDPS